MAHNPPEGSKRQHHDDAEFNNSKADNLCFEWNDGVGLQKDPPDSIRRKIICRRCQKPYAWWYIKHYRPQYADSESRAEIVGVEAYFRKKVARANGEASRLRLDLERVNTENDNLKQSNAEKDVELNEMMEVVREQQQIIDEVKVIVKELNKGSAE